ncbi:deaminated glutathione amidase isoform X1 [Cuculus canorus]|uniref:deaminated glutathione amidase isoform X1 n=1 Tax=Cuculus canorus TaxID=55661 RepID=UPI0023AB2332|nr:deaminated glutathione amidase isoform X1 [Cuculus canorus]XP_053906747.1 deaminated glutathione amidase isoform X1 [Cuculus canorus]
MASSAPALKPLVAVAQVTSTPDKEQNFAACVALVREAAERGAGLVFLPEAFDFIGRDAAQTLSMAEPLDGDLMGRYAQLARDCGVWLSLGGFHERGHDWATTQRIYNCHALLGHDGRLVAAYRKAHLCDVELEGRVSMWESSFTNPGTELVAPVPTPAGKLGLSVCYDLRFPELSLALRRAGAEILTFPSAFTVPTGSAHWEQLRAHHGTTGKVPPRHFLRAGNSGHKEGAGRCGRCLFQETRELHREDEQSRIKKYRSHRNYTKLCRNSLSGSSTPRSRGCHPPPTNWDGAETNPVPTPQHGQSGLGGHREPRPRVAPTAPRPSLSQLPAGEVPGRGFGVPSAPGLSLGRGTRRHMVPGPDLLQRNQR